MYISKLRIKNFRNFGAEPFEMKLKPFTLVLGENNIGKTNLLSALSLLFSQEISVVQRRSLENDDINYDTVAAFKRQVADEATNVEDVVFPEVVIDVTVGDITEDQHPVIGDWYSNTTLTEAQITYRFSLPGSFNRDEWVTEQRLALKDLRAKSDASQQAEDGDEQGGDEPTVNDDVFLRFVDFPIGKYRHTIYGGGQPSNECDAYLLRMLRVEILDALRDAERELIAGGDQRLLYRVLRQSSDSRYNDLKESLQELESVVHDNSSLTTIKEEVEALLKQVSLMSAGEDHSIGLQFTAPEAAEILKKIGMTYGANPITVARNGLGRNNLLYVALVLSQLAKAPDATPGNDDYVCFRLVGIEEPEAHLHPHQQDHLARNIESVREKHSDNLQLILTSHSTHVAAKLALKNTAVLFRSDTDGTIASHYILDGIDREKDKDAIRFLSLYLDAVKSRMFFARRLILVEGIAEQTVIPVLFQQSTGDSLESIGCTVINVNGVAFRHFLTIVKKGFFKKCVVLTDSDTGTKTENRAKNLQADFKQERHISIQCTEESTFEKDLIAANRSGEQKQILFDALCVTKPDNGPTLQKKTGESDIDVEEFFTEIEHYKAEFAFSLLSVAQEKEANLAIPSYITEAFAFIKGA